MIESIELQLDAKGPVRLVTRNRQLYCRGAGWEFALCETEDDRGCDVSYGPGTLDIFLIGAVVAAMWQRDSSGPKSTGFPLVISRHSVLAWIKNGTGLQPIHIEVSP